MDEESELYHWGVKGMRWGVRHDRKTGRVIGHPTAKGESSYAKGGNRRKARAAKAKTMTEDEIQRALKRIRMETEYVQLTKPPMERLVDDGIEIVRNSMKSSSQQFLTSYSTHSMERIARAIDSTYKPSSGKKKK